MLFEFIGFKIEQQLIEDFRFFKRQMGVDNTNRF